MFFGLENTERKKILLTLIRNCGKRKNAKRRGGQSKTGRKGKRFSGVVLWEVDNVGQIVCFHRVLGRITIGLFSVFLSSNECVDVRLSSLFTL